LKLKFTKMQGVGNDFVVLDGIGQLIDLVGEVVHDRHVAIHQHVEQEVQEVRRALGQELRAPGQHLVGRSDRPLLADGTADSNSKMIAVAAPYQAGVSLLYVIDTQNRQLAVYEARGGSKSSGRLVFVAARKIDLDLRLEGYHDDSEFSFADLTASFRKSGWTEPKDAPKVGASETSEVQVPKKDK